MSETLRPSPEAPSVIPDIGTETNSEKKKKKDGKTKAKALILGGKAAETVVDAPKPNPESDPTKKPESLWQKLVRDDAKSETDTADNPNRDTVEADAEKKDLPPLETLSSDEEHEAIRQYAEARLEDVGQFNAEPTDQEQTAVEDAADAALLEAVQQKIAEDPERPVAQVLDEAEREVIENIQEQDAAESPAQEILRGSQESEPIDAVVEAEPDPRTTTARATVPPVVPPIVPPTGSGGAASSGGPAGGGSGGPSSGPTAKFNSYPGASSASTAELHFAVNERAAVARGLVVGGIVGYLIGKRRGRIKTERKLKPVQEKLQKQVETLTAAVAEKEQRVRSLAAEKSAVLQTQADKQRFAEKLRPAPAAEVVATSSKVETLSTAEKARKTGGLQVERLGRIIVETPAAIFAGAAAKPSEVIDFNKKVETYSAQEMEQASEKIRVDGVALKEIQQNYNLDDRSMRRIVKQFVEGGNVREALNREIVEKELKYERDPRMRAAKSSGQDNTGGAAAVASAGLLSLLGSDKTASADTSGSTGPGAYDKNTTGPKPDPATLAKLRRKQATELAAASVTIIVFFAVLIVLLI